jgi:uncharacterized membrane protein
LTGSSKNKAAIVEETFEQCRNCVENDEGRWIVVTPMFLIFAVINGVLGLIGMLKRSNRTIVTFNFVAMFVGLYMAQRSITLH